MSNSAAYYIGDELDPLGIWWFGGTGALVDFTVAHTYSSILYSANDSAHTNVFGSAKTTGFTGAVGSGVEGGVGAVPNLSVAWATTGELNAVAAAGLFIFQVVATRTSDSRQRTLEAKIQMKVR